MSNENYIENSPLLAFGVANTQSQYLNEEIKEKDIGMIAKFNQQVNNFLEKLRNEKTDIDDLDYLPTIDSLNEAQKMELVNIRNSLGLQELVPDNKLSPAEIIKAAKAKKLAEINKLFSPPELVKIKDIEVVYNPFYYYDEKYDTSKKENIDDTLINFIKLIEAKPEITETETIKNNGSNNMQIDNTSFSREKIQKVIDIYSNKQSPLNADDYIKVSQMTGVPVDALLTQGALESNFGTKGRAVETKNVGNVGNTDSGANEYQKSWFDGLLRQAILLKNEYANPDGNFTADTFIANDFKRPTLGGRYATDPDYGAKYKQILSEVRSILYKPEVATNTNQQGDYGERQQKILDTFTWGKGTADFVFDSKPLSIIKPPLYDWKKVTSPTTYRDVPAGTKAFNISTKNGKQINIGTDFGVPVGTPVLSVVNNAVVVNAGMSPFDGGGLNVRIKFEIDGETYYADYNHLSEVKVKPGQEVQAGAIIGLSGATGNVTGPHLDFSIFKIKNGRYQFLDTSSIFN